jgi:putative membrane protein
LLVSRALKRENVERAARAAFVELAVGSTRQRTGILVFVSMFERDAEVVLDVGFDLEQLGQEWTDAVRRIRLAARLAEPDALITALEGVAPILERCLPCSPDDVDELGNELRVA